MPADPGKEHFGPARVTVPPPQPSGFASALSRNIRALQARREAEEIAAGFEERVAERITRFTGSMRFVYLHLALFGAWVIVNSGFVPGAPRFDPTFVILATWASVEAIFLSTFVLISQNRATKVADKRADLDLQISLLAEHEITKLMTLITAIAAKLDIAEVQDPELEELRRDVAPEAVLDAMSAGEDNGDRHGAVRPE